MKHLNYISILIVLILSTFHFVSISQPATKIDLIEKIFQDEGEKYFSFFASDRSLIEQLSHGISIDRVENSGKVFAYANKKEFARFLEYGLAYDILPHPGDFHGELKILDQINLRDIEEWDFYPTYDAYVDLMYQFAEQYPSLCQVFSIGQSNQGREILFAKISDNVSLKENEPQFLYTSSIHGDELTGYILTLRLIDYLLSNYGTVPKVTDMVNGIEIWINPLSNPDGTYAGGNSTVDGARRYNALWVDLNRNYPDAEDGPHPDGEDWQTETMRFMELAEDNHFVSGTNFHGGEEVCNYPWDTWSRLAVDDEWWQYVCHEYADTVHLYAPSNYMSDFDDGITNGYAWYTISGGRQDYMNYFHQMREFTLEISDVKLPDPSQLPSFWQYNYRSMLNYIEQSAFGVRGTIKDSVSGWPVKAEVYTILHDLDSSWVYSSLPIGNYHRLLYAGNYTLRFSAPGYETKVVNNVQVVNRQATVLDIKLVPNGVGGISNYAVNRAISLYPNPASNNYLYFDADIPVSRITVSDITGHELIAIQVYPPYSGIDIRNLQPGLYFIRFDTEEGIGIKKFLVNR